MRRRVANATRTTCLSLSTEKRHEQPLHFVPQSIARRLLLPPGCITRRQESLGTKDKATAQRVLNARNEADLQPAINRQIAQAYLRAAADPKMITRTWQEVMEAILARHDGETLRRWKTAVKDQAFNAIRKRPLVETTAEELLNVTSEAPSAQMSTCGGCTITPSTWIGCSSQQCPSGSGPRWFIGKARPSRRRNISALSSGSKMGSAGRFTNCSGTWAVPKRTWPSSMRRTWIGRIERSPTAGRSCCIVKRTRPRPFWRRSRTHAAAVAAAGRVISLPAHRASRGSLDRVQATLRRVGDQGRHPSPSS